MILITGATGKIGGAVVRQLLQLLPSTSVAALVRNSAKADELRAAGVDVRIGDYDDPGSLSAAMRGVEKVLLVSGGHADNGLEQHHNVVDAAVAAGVTCIAYTGRSLRDPETLANKLMQRHFQTEEYIRRSGAKYVLFRNALYMDVLPMYVDASMMNSGVRLPGGQVAFALRREMGEAIANILATGDCNDRVYSFTGSETYSFGDVAVGLSDLTGKDIPYLPVSIGEYAQDLRSRGLDSPFLPKMLDFLSDIESGQESIVSMDLANVLGRPPASLRAGLNELFTS